MYPTQKKKKKGYPEQIPITGTTPPPNPNPPHRNFPHSKNFPEPPTPHKMAASATTTAQLPAQEQSQRECLEQAKAKVPVKLTGKRKEIDEFLESFDVSQGKEVGGGKGDW